MTEQALFLPEQIGRYTITHGSDYVVARENGGRWFSAHAIWPQYGRTRAVALEGARQSVRQRIEQEEWRAMHGD